MHSHALNMAVDPTGGIVLVGVLLLIGLLFIKFLLKLAWRLVTLGCVIIVFFVFAAALGVHLLK